MSVLGAVSAQGRSPRPPRHRHEEFDHLSPLLSRYADLDTDHPDRSWLREELVSGFYPVVSRIAARYRDRGEPVEDLEQVGALGLVRAIDRFDPTRGCRFLGFAVPTVTGEIRRHFRDRTWSMHVPRGAKDLQARLAVARDELSSRLERAPRVSELAVHLDVGRDAVIDALAAQQAYKAVSLDLPVGESDTTVGDLVGGSDSRIGMVDARVSVRPAIEGLPERERTILELRFFEDMTQTQIAERVGVSQMQVSRLLARTLAGLRRDLATGPDDEPDPAPGRRTALP